MHDLLLEREPAVGALDEALALLRADGRSRLLLLDAPAGAGKSRLLRELVARAEGTRVVRARCSALERDHSYGVPLALLGRMVEQARSAGADPFTGAAVTARDLFGAGDRDSLPASSRVYGLHWLTADLANAGPEPLVALVDDVQWADLGSLRYLNFLAERLEDLPVLLAVARRSGDVEGEHGELLDRLFATPGSRRLPTPPLSPAAVTRLVREAFPGAPDALGSRCAAATGGNPFLVVEVVNELAAAGVDPVDDGVAVLDRLDLGDITRAIATRLRDLPPAARDLARAGAVLGGDVDLVDAAAVTARSVEELAIAADTLTRAGVMAREDGQVRFAHPLIASAVTRSIGDGERSVLHRRAARALAERGKPLAVVAAQLVEATPAGDPWAVGVLREAAAAATAQGTPESAVTYLARALAEPPAPEERTDLLVELGRAELLAARGAEAITHLTSALDPAGDPAVAATVHNLLGRAHYQAGEFEAAAASFAAGADPALGAPLEVRLQNEADLISAGALVPGLLPDLGERLGGAVGVVRAQPQLSAPGRAILGSAALLASISGRPGEEALGLAELSLDDGRLLEEEGADGQTLYSVTGAFTSYDRLSRSIEILDLAVEAARRSGSVHGYVTASYARAEPELRLGRLDDAIVDARAAIDPGDTSWRQYLPSAYSAAIRALVESDELDEARELLAAAEREDWDSSLAWAIMHGARGDLRLASGDVAGALEDYLEWGRRWPIWSPAVVAEWRSSAAVAAVAVGDRDRALRLAEEELALVAELGSARSTGVALRAVGLARGGEEGVATLREAEATLARSESVLEHVRAVVMLGAQLRRLGQRSQARAELERAVDLARTRGLAALERRAAEELEIAGGRAGRRPRDGAEALSPGERRVVAMAAEGLTNREIAQALFVSRKAVEWHLGNAYRKLGIAGRGELAAVLVGSLG